MNIKIKAYLISQACNELYPGKKVKFLSTILWLAATYVLADVYSAQLTSQLARPAREAVISVFCKKKKLLDACIYKIFCILIDTLHKLEHAMTYNGYQLFVERQSSSLSALEVCF